MLQRLWQTERSGIIWIGLTWFFFFVRILSGTHVYFLDDLKLFYYPIETIYAEFQHSGHLPLWSNVFGFGHPLLAWGQLGFFTPLHFLLRALYIPALNLLQISLVTYFAIGLSGLYTFLRQCRLSPLASAFGSIVFIFAGFNIGHLNHVNFYVGTMVLPWLLVAILRFTKQPSLRLSSIVALLGATIAVSAQPQIVAYCFVIAGITAIIFFVHHFFSLTRSHRLHYLIHFLVLGIIATILALGISSITLLPLFEFLPYTERSAGLSTTELLDFSFPPYHFITFLAPYFFGDHANYWGPKGFQELAAYTGMIPLLLAASSLFSWRTHRPLRILGLALICFSLPLLLGSYSPLYRYLVSHEIISALSIPGRFVLLLDFGLALLAAIGLSDFLNQKLKLSRYFGAILITIAIFLPFAYTATLTPQIRLRLYQLISQLNWSFLLAGLGFIATLWAWLWPFRLQRRHYASILLGITAFTLIAYGWSYNPITSRAQVQSTSPLLTNTTLITPARIFSQHQLLISQAATKLHTTEDLSPSFSIKQPIFTWPESGCFSIAMHAKPEINSHITVTISSDLDSREILASQSIASSLITSNDNQIICFPSFTPTADQNLILSFTSLTDSGVNLYYQSEPATSSTYLIRVANPTLSQLQASAKPGQIMYQTYDFDDTESITLNRHLNAAAGLSSANWIGSLSILSYREFVDTFFGNDQENVDGDGHHVLAKNRHIFNMASVNYFAQILNPNTQDIMPSADFSEESVYQFGDKTAKLYFNPEAFPKAYLVRNAEYVPPADEARTIMLDPEFNPSQLVLISGTSEPKHLPAYSSDPINGTVNTTVYEPTRIDIDVTTDTEAWLVVTDASIPLWQTYIDGELAPYYVANTVFKTARVPAGNHTVSFRYISPATQLASKLCLSALAISILILIIPFKRLSHK